MLAAPRAVIAWPFEAEPRLSGGLGFSRRQRLSKAAEFEAVFDHRCAVRTAYFQVLAKPNEVGHARLGLVVSRRLFPHAVDRNRIRRRIREAFRQLAPQLPALDIVVRPQAVPAQPGAREEHRRDLLEALAKAAEKCSPAC